MKCKLYGGRNDGAEFDQKFPNGEASETLILPWCGMSHQMYRLRDVLYAPQAPCMSAPIVPVVALYDFVGPTDQWGKLIEKKGVA